MHQNLSQEEKENKRHDQNKNLSEDEKQKKVEHMRYCYLAHKE